MDWKKLLNTDLTGFLPNWLSGRRRLSVQYPFPSLSQRLRTVLGTVFTDLIHVTFCLSQAVACNAPLVPALDAMMDDVPTSRILRSLARLRAALNAGMSLSEAVRRQPRFFPRFYADLIAAGERSGTLQASLREASDMLRRCQQLMLSTWAIWAHLAQTTVCTLVMVAFMQTKILPVFREIFMDFAEHNGQTASFPDAFFAKFGSLFRLMGDLVDTIHFGHWPAPVRVLFLVAVLLTSVVGALRFRRSHILVSMLQRLPGLGRVVNKARWAVVSDALSRLLQAGYPLDEALDSILADARGRYHRRQIARLRDSVRQGSAFYEALAAEGRRLPLAVHDLVFVGETSGRLPEALAELSHLFREQATRAGMIVSRIGFCAVIVALGCVVFQVYAGGFMGYISMVGMLLDSLSDCPCCA